VKKNNFIRPGKEISRDGQDIQDRGRRKTNPGIRMYHAKLAKPAK